MRRPAQVRLREPRHHNPPLRALCNLSGEPQCEAQGIADLRAEFDAFLRRSD